MDLEKLFFTQEDAAFIHEQSLKVLAETGCVFDDEKARNVLQKHGATCRWECGLLHKGTGREGAVYGCGFSGTLSS